MYRPSGNVETDACVVLGPQIVNYQQTMLDIHSELGSLDVIALKFLCTDIIPLGTLERLKYAINVIGEFENMCYITPPDNVMFLAELLWHIGRCDLIESKLRVTKEHVEFNYLPDKNVFHLSPYRVMLHNLCQDMTTTDCFKLKFLCEPRIARLESIKEPQDLFAVLESQRKISKDDVSFLLQQLRQLRREDLARKVEQYCRESRLTRVAEHEVKSSTKVALDKLDSATNIAVSMLPAAPSDRQPIVKQYSRPADDGTNSIWHHDVTVGRLPHDVIESHNVHRRNTGEAGLQRLPVDERLVNGLQERFDNFSLPRDIQQLHSVQAIQDEVEMPCYSMKRRPRGICLIISNECFYKIEKDSESRQMNKREGTKTDQESLEQIFKKLNFNVDVRTNLTAEEMARCLSDMARIDHSSYDCFVCCILSHGALGSVYGVNGRTVGIRDLLSDVKAVKCPSLGGKPKIFFIQACQGTEKQPGCDIETDASERDASLTETVPNEADFLLGLSTVPGYVSYRSKSQGSWYIATLVRSLDQLAFKHDLLGILTHVNHQVSEAATKEGSYRQVPQPVHTLRKRIMFQ